MKRITTTFILLSILTLIPHLVLAESFSFYAGRYFAGIITSNEWHKSDCPPPIDIPSINSAIREVISYIPSSQKSSYEKEVRSFLKDEPSLREAKDEILRAIREMRSAGFNCKKIQDDMFWPVYIPFSLEWEKAKLDLLQKTN